MIEQFWQKRGSLEHVRDFARGRRVCPWSTLGVVLVRASCHIPPHVYLPPLVGGRTSLNLFCALVGPSGVGKGGSESAGRDAVAFTGSTIFDLQELPLGSGEGIARTFTGDDSPHTALFTAAEIDSIAALFTRQGSTLEGELRKMWTGETLGFTNAQKTTRTHVERLSYRAGVIVGVQPLRAQALLSGADGGTPQRFVWLPVLDPDRPTERPDTPEPISVQVPIWMPGDVVVPDIAIQAVDAHQAAIHRSDPDVDPLAGHALLCRLKVACGLMLLDGRNEERPTITDDDWRLAGTVMAVSDTTRASVQRAVREGSRIANRARAHAAVEREEFASEHKMQRAREAIIRRIDTHGQQTKNECRMAMKIDIRDYLEPALADLMERGEITVSPAQRGPHRVHVYHRYMAEKPHPTSANGSCTESTHVPTPLSLTPDREPSRRQRTYGKYRDTQQTQVGTA